MSDKEIEIKYGVFYELILFIYLFFFFLLHFIFAESPSVWSSSFVFLTENIPRFVSWQVSRQTCFTLLRADVAAKV